MGSSNSRGAVTNRGELNRVRCPGPAVSPAYDHAMGGRKIEVRASVVLLRDLRGRPNHDANNWDRRTSRALGYRRSQVDAAGTAGQEDSGREQPR